MDLIANPYRGPANVPHVPENFFSIVFYSANWAFTILALPGRWFGTEVRPRRYNRDFIMRTTEEHAVMRQYRRGKIPTFSYRRPTYTNHSWVRMWDRHLHWKRWTLERTGPAYSAT